MKFLFLSLFFVSNFSFADGLNPVGRWVVAEKDAKVEIYEKDGTLEGKIVWLRDPNEADGNLKRDTKNPDDKLRSRTILNLVFLTGFKKEAKEQKWSGGSVYDPKSGKTYKGWIKMLDEDSMKLRGYIGISLFGRTEEWTRDQ